eukprot:1155962-Pelagomonas_calceolata.AAC.2
MQQHLSAPPLLPAAALGWQSARLAQPQLWLGQYGRPAPGGSTAASQRTWCNAAGTPRCCPCACGVSELMCELCVSVCECARASVSVRVLRNGTCLIPRCICLSKLAGMPRLLNGS